MPYSPNLGIIHLDPSQSNKAATVNEQLDALDVAIAGTVSLSVAGGANVTLTTTPDGGQAENAIIELTGAITANIEVIFPPITRSWHVVNNTTGAHTVTVISTSGTGAVVAQGTEADFRFDGTNMVQASSTIAGGGGVVTMSGDVTGPSSSNTVVNVNGNPPGVMAVAHKFVTAIDSSARGTLAQPAFSDLSGNISTAQLVGTPTSLGFYIGGVPTAGQYQKVQLPWNLTIPANCATPNSYGKLGTAATASTVFDIQQNGTTVATVTFAASGTTPTFATTGGVAINLSAGDVISLVAPASPDATAADLTVTLVGTR